MAEKMCLLQADSYMSKLKTPPVPFQLLQKCNRNDRAQSDFQWLTVKNYLGCICPPSVRQFKINVTSDCYIYKMNLAYIFHQPKENN